jgi:Fe2+ transport system protein FeoA
MATATGTTMTVTSWFASSEQMEQLAAMGMVEGMTQAMSQIDALIATG